MEAAKKIIFLVAGPLRGGEGLNGFATKEKITFFNIRKKVPMATKPGGGAERTFFVASLMNLL